MEEQQKPKKSIKEVIEGVNDFISRIYKHKEPVLQPIEGYAKLTTVNYIPCGYTAVETSLGGGFPDQAIITIHGSPYSGKTGMCLSMSAKMIKDKKHVLYVAPERLSQGLTKALFERFGITDEEITTYFHMQESGDGGGEKLIDIIDACLWDRKTGTPHGVFSLVVLDSIQGLWTQMEDEKTDKEGSGGFTTARRASLINSFLTRVMGRNYFKYGGMFMIVVQDRANLSAAPGMPATQMGGGMAIKYDSDVIIRLTSILHPDLKGRKIKYKIFKNKALGLNGSGEYDIIDLKGVSDIESLIAKGLEYGYIVPEGRTKHILYFPDGDRVVDKGGKSGLKAYLEKWAPERINLEDLILKGKPTTPPQSVGHTINFEQVYMNSDDKFELDPNIKSDDETASAE